MLKTGLQEINSIKLLNLYSEGHIKPYWNNRGHKISGKAVGEVKVSQKTESKIYEELIPLAFGTVTICLIKKKNNQSEYYIVDGHSRLSGLMKRYEDREIPDEDCDFFIDLKVIEVPDKRLLKLIYENLNNQSAHSSNNKLTNDDYEVGELSQKLLTEAGIDKKHDFFEFDKARLVFCSILATLYETQGIANSVYDYPDAYGRRGRVNKLYNRIKGQNNKFRLTLTDSQEDNTVKALEYYIECRDYFISLIPVDENGLADDFDFYRIFETVGCFGSIVCDRLNTPKNRKITNMSAKELGKRLFDNSKALVDNFKRTTNGSDDHRRENFNIIVSTLNKKVKKRRIAA